MPFGGTNMVPKKYLGVFVMLASCFALWGLLNNMTDNLVPSFQKIFMTSQSTAGFVQISLLNPRPNPPTTENHHRTHHTRREPQNPAAYLHSCASLTSGQESASPL